MSQQIPFNFGLGRRSSPGEKGERKEQDKEKDNFSMCSDSDADLEKQDRKNQEIEDQKSNDRKTPHPSPKPSSVDAFTPKPSKSCIKQFNNQSGASQEVEDTKIFYTLATLPGHENTETLESID